MVLVSPALAAALVFGAPAVAQDVAQEEVKQSAWMQDFAAAQEKAKTENKDLFIDFTGSDWCGWCIKLDDEVFSAGDFETKIQEQYVLVKLDYPKDPAIVTDEVRAQNKVLMARYGVQSFPTILLTDAAGNPYASTGYEPGGPEKYLEHLAEKRQAKEKFAAALTALASLEGAEKARKLDEALSLLDPAYLLPFYVAHVDEILALDANGEAGLAKKYTEMKNAHAERVALMELEEVLAPAFEKQDWDAAFKAIDGFVAKQRTANPELAQRVFLSKIGIYMEQRKFDDAVKVVEEARAIAPDSEIMGQADMIIAQIKMMAEQAKEGDGEEHSEHDGHDHGSDGN